MSQEEIKIFKTAFIIFIVGHLLAPSTKHDYGTFTYWHALENTDELQYWNWGEFVLDALCQAASRIKNELSNKSNISYITGCTLFLQVFYLDNADLGPMNMDHSILPRISVFNNEILKNMIQSDTLVTGERSEATFGKSLPRSSVNMKTDGEIWTAAHKLADDMRLPTMCAASIYKEIMSHNKRCAERLNKIVEYETVQLIGKLGSIGKQWRHVDTTTKDGNGYQTYEQDRDGGRNKNKSNKSCSLGTGDRKGKRAVTFSQYLSSRSPNGSTKKTRLFENDDQRRLFEDCPSFSLGIDFDSPVLGNKNDADNMIGMTTPEPTVGGAMSISQITPPRSRRSPSTNNFLEQQMYVYERDTRFMDRVNLNVRTLEFDISSSPFVKRRARLLSTNQRQRPQEHIWHYQLDICNKFQKWLHNVNDKNTCESLWIMHYTPRYIDITAGTVKRHMCMFDDMEHDFFDIVIRRFKQYDEERAKEPHSSIVKHFMESDVATCIMAQHSTSAYLAVREQFIGPHVKHDLPNCNLMLLPGKVNFTWVCYAFEFSKSRITVFDPTLSMDGSSSLPELHIKICNQMKTSLKQCAKDFFENWQYDWESMSVHIMQCKSTTTLRNCTGLATLMFCRYFDGNVDNFPEMQGNANEFASLILYDILHLRGNSGYLPKEFVQMVSD